MHPLIVAVGASAGVFGLQGEDCGHAARDLVGGALAAEKADAATAEGREV